MRLALDHHYSVRIAVRLRDRGHDVVAVIEQGWEAESDEDLLTLCGEQHRALLTNNARDLAVIARSWSTQGRSHPGLIFTSDASMPRSRHSIGRYVQALDAVLRAHPRRDALVDRILWL